MVLGRDFEQIQGVWTFNSPPLNNLINFLQCLCERQFFLVKYKFMLVHRSNFLLENMLSSLYSFNSSLQNRDEIVILHYSSLNLLTFTINTFTSSICWIVLVLINLFCASSSIGWTSLFDKFKLVRIFSSMCWTY